MFKVLQRLVTISKEEQEDGSITFLSRLLVMKAVAAS